VSWKNRDIATPTEEMNATTVEKGSIFCVKTILQSEQIYVEKGEEKVFDVSLVVSATSKLKQLPWREVPHIFFCKISKKD